MLAASAAPSAAPAPTIVCSSSMKRITAPSDSATSRSTAFRRSSNSPRYFEPAISAPTSSAITRLSFRLSGTSPATMRRARPSTIAVLPTPGSPISTGLFLVRRESTCITRRISSSRPITGSSLPARAASVRSRPNFASAWYLDSGSWSVMGALPRTLWSALSMAARVAPASRSRAPTSSVFSSAAASSRCSVETYSSLRASASLEGGLEDAVQRGRERRLRAAVHLRQAREPLLELRLEARRAARRSSGGSGPCCLRAGRRSARSRCAGVIWLWPRPVARLWASERASWLLRVSLSKRMRRTLGTCAGRASRRPGPAPAARSSAA